MSGTDRPTAPDPARVASASSEGSALTWWSVWGLSLSKSVMITARGAIPGLFNLVDFFGKLLFGVFHFVFDKIFHMGSMRMESSTYWEFSNFLVKFGKSSGKFREQNGQFLRETAKKMGEKSSRKFRGLFQLAMGRREPKKTTPHPDLGPILQMF